MEKRNLFAEISAGFDALAGERSGRVALKNTLRTVKVEARSMPKIKRAEKPRTRHDG